MTGAMNSKFVSAGSSQDAAEDGKQLLEAEDSNNPGVQDAKKAAQMKMFGKLTREKVDWHPAKILCIRFNVKHPYGDYSVVGVPKTMKIELFKNSRFINDPNGKETAESESKEEAMELVPAIENEASESKSAKKDENVNLNKEKEEEVIEKPPIDLFQSIFLDSDNSESEDEDKTDKKTEDAVKEKHETVETNKKKELFGTELGENENEGSAANKWEDKKVNLLRNKNPAQGLFANIDFEALNNPKKKNKSQEELKKVPSDQESSSKKGSDKIQDISETDKPPASKRPRASDFFEKESSEPEEDLFGPAKPPDLRHVAAAAGDTTDDSDSSNGAWKEKKKKKTKSKKKKSKKSKKLKKKDRKKKKSKKKKAKKRVDNSEEESSSSSESSD